MFFFLEPEIELSGASKFKILLVKYFNVLGSGWLDGKYFQWK